MESIMLDAIECAYKPQPNHMPEPHNIIAILYDIFPTGPKAITDAAATIPAQALSRACGRPLIAGSIDIEIQILKAVSCNR